MLRPLLQACGSRFRPGCRSQPAPRGVTATETQAAGNVPLRQGCVLSRASSPRSSREERVKELPERGMRPGNSAADAGRRSAGKASLHRHSSVTLTAALELPRDLEQHTGSGQQLGSMPGADRGPSPGCHPTQHCPGHPGPPQGAHPSLCGHKHSLTQPFSCKLLLEGCSMASGCSQASQRCGAEPSWSPSGRVGTTGQLVRVHTC